MKFLFLENKGANDLIDENKLLIDANIEQEKNIVQNVI
jgi:hypothetical protein